TILGAEMVAHQPSRQPSRPGDIAERCPLNAVLRKERQRGVADSGAPRQIRKPREVRRVRAIHTSCRLYTRIETPLASASARTATHAYGQTPAGSVGVMSVPGVDQVGERPLEDLVQNASQQAVVLAREQLDIARQELTARARQAFPGAAMVGGGALFAALAS